MVRGASVTAQQQGRRSPDRPFRDVQRASCPEHGLLHDKGGISADDGLGASASGVKGSFIRAAVQGQRGIAAYRCVPRTAAPGIGAAINITRENGSRRGDDAHIRILGDGKGPGRAGAGAPRMGTAHNTLDEIAGCISQVNRHVGASGDSSPGSGIGFIRAAADDEAPGHGIEGDGFVRLALHAAHDDVGAAVNGVDGIVGRRATAHQGPLDHGIAVHGHVNVPRDGCVQSVLIVAAHHPVHDRIPLNLGMDVPGHVPRAGTAPVVGIAAADDDVVITVPYIRPDTCGDGRSLGSGAGIVIAAGQNHARQAVSRSRHDIHRTEAVLHGRTADAVQGHGLLVRKSAGRGRGSAPQSPGGIPHRIVSAGARKRDDGFSGGIADGVQ